MGFNRENVIWQSSKNTWSRGFYRTYDTPYYNDDDYDSEWDVEYDYGSFENYRGGFATEEEAADWQPGANPGGYNLIPANRKTAASINGLNRMALRLTNPEKAKALDWADTKKRMKSDIQRKMDEGELKEGQRVSFNRHNGHNSAETYLGYIMKDDDGRTLVKADNGQEFVLTTPSGKPSIVDRIGDLQVQKTDRFTPRFDPFKKYDAPKKKRRGTCNVKRHRTASAQAKCPVHGRR